MDKKDVLQQLRYALPKTGKVFSTDYSNLPEVLCKPKLLPLKSMTLKKLEDLEKNFTVNAGAQKK